MASFLNTLHLWTTKENTVISDENIGCLVYHDKNEIASDRQYSTERQNFIEGRGNVWTVSNKRPDKLRDALKELQELSTNYRCINIEWKTAHVIQAIFNNGTFVFLFINMSTGDLEKISIDKFLIGKLYSEHVVDVIQDENNIMFSYVEPKLTHIQLSKKPFLVESNRKWEKLSSLNPKITNIDLIGPTGRRLERYLSCNVKHNLLLLWWRTSNNEVWPWTPLSTDKERANMHLYSMNGQKFELVSYCRTEGEPMSASFSKIRIHLILTLEQKVSHSSDVFAERCMYEVTVSKLQRLATASIPLSSPIVCQEQNPQEDKILISCTDGSLIMYDDYRRTTQTTKASFTSTVIAWHPSGCMVVVSSDKGEILCFDQGLSCIHFHLLAEDPLPNKTINISEYFKNQIRLIKMDWAHQQLTFPEMQYYPAMDSMVIILDRGPFALLQMHLGVLNKNPLTAIDLVIQYIKHGQIDEAVNLLGSLNWNTEGQMCYFNLMTVVNNLLRMPLTATRESQLEAAFGTFYAPLRPLSKITILEYRDRVRNLARRFFHHLLRFQRLEKASLLAIDIGSSDLFRDLYYVAMDHGDHSLAEMALKNAEGIEDYASETDSNDSGDSADNYSDSSFSSEYSNLSPTGEKVDPSAAHASQFSSQNISVQHSLIGQVPPKSPNSQNLVKTFGEMKIFKATPAETKSIPMSSMQPVRSQQIPGEISNYVRQPEQSGGGSNVTTNYQKYSQRSSIQSSQEQHPQMETRSVTFKHSLAQVDPNECFVDEGPLSAVDSEDEDGSGTVRVVHFGIV